MRAVLPDATIINITMLELGTKPSNSLDTDVPRCSIAVCLVTAKSELDPELNGASIYVIVTWHISIRSFPRVIDCPAFSACRVADRH